VITQPNSEDFMEWHNEQYTISTDKERLNIRMIHHFLYTSAYWATGRSMSVVRKSIENSLCFGVYDGEEQVGFARVITDYATNGWVCDCFILQSHRGRGLGRWLVETMMEHPDIKGLRRILLNTRDAHELYTQYGGFRQLLKPESWLERFNDSAVKNAGPVIQTRPEKKP
jgi:GNAT superfamily N-acetyltransferase